MSKESYTTKDEIKFYISIIFSAVVAYLVYKYVIDPLGSTNFMHISKGWKIGLAIFVFFMCVGIGHHLDNVFGFYEKANKRLGNNNKQRTKSSTEKIKDLKELRDQKIITKKEFEEKKKKLLEEL